MDQVSVFCQGLDNIDQMAREIQSVITRIARYGYEEFGKKTPPQHPRHVQLGSWWIYSDKARNYRLMIRVDVLSTTLVLYDEADGGNEYSQPPARYIKAVRQELPKFLEAVLKEFHSVAKGFKPFFEAAGV